MRVTTYPGLVLQPYILSVAGRVSLRGAKEQMQCMKRPVRRLVNPLMRCAVFMTAYEKGRAMLGLLRAANMQLMAAEAYYFVDHYE